MGKYSEKQNGMSDIQGSMPKIQNSLSDRADSVTGIQSPVTSIQDSATGIQGPIPGIQDSVTDIQGSKPGIQDSVYGITDHVPGIQDSVTAILDLPVTTIKGIGEKRGALLAKLGIHNIRDAICTMPRVYEDRSNFKKIFELCDGDRCSFEGTVASTVSETRPGRGLTVSRVLITDGTSSVTAIWFNQGYIKKIFKKGQRYIFYGKITANRGLNITGSRRLKLTGISGLEIHNPVYRLVKETHKTPADCEGPEHNSFLNILPVYPSISGLHQGILRSVIKDSLEIFFGHGGMDEIIPGWIRRKYGLEEINYSLKNVHFPENRDAFLKARYRLVFEELLLLQLRLYSIKNKLTDSAVKVRNLKNESEPLREFLKELPFELTPGQKRVLKEIETDMNSPKAMNRLVQGDVGSGKTVLAAAALYKNAKDGYQGVMMVPTGILAKQHYDFLKPLFNKHRINVELVTGDMHPRQKKKILEGISGGNVHVVVGTHALLEENVEFHNLNLVITDEQHRFGVRQRAVLNSKGETPDILVMSATPIPSVNAGIFLTPKTPVKI